MKIPLHSTSNGNQTPAAARTQALGRDLVAAKRGDWEAKHRVEATLMPIMQDLARKRANSNKEINAMIDAGKQGIAKAIKKFKPNVEADRFQIFALRFIEDEMDNPGSDGFFSRIFGG